MGQSSLTLSATTAADLTAKRYYAAKETSAGLALCATLGERCDGVIGVGNTGAVSIERGPKVRIKAGAAFARGANLTPNASGKFVTASTGHHVAFIAAQAALADGETLIENPAREPEIADVAECLNKMGARIVGAGTERIVVSQLVRSPGVYFGVNADKTSPEKEIVDAKVIPSRGAWLEFEVEDVDKTREALAKLGIARPSPQVATHGPTEGTL